MIEEAAGTRMYEAKKQQAQKTIEKKDAKLKEINDVREMFWRIMEFSCGIHSLSILWNSWLPHKYNHIQKFFLQALDTVLYNNVLVFV